MAKPSGEGWVSFGLAVLGGLGSLVGIAALFTKDLLILLAFVAGTGWILAIPLLVMIRREAQMTEDLRAELQSVRGEKAAEAEELRRQISEWRTIATQDSDSLNRFVSRAVEMPTVQPRRPAVHVAATQEAGGSNT